MHQLVTPHLRDRQVFHNTTILPNLSAVRFLTAIAGFPSPDGAHSHHLAATHRASVRELDRRLPSYIAATVW